MQDVIYFLVNAGGQVFVKDDASSHPEIEADPEEDESACGMYRFDLTGRRLLTDRGNPSTDRTARGFVDEYLRTPEKLMRFAESGRLTKLALVNLLAGDQRRRYLDACAAIEKKYTDDCAAKNDPCLESGCAVEGEVCLEAVLGVGNDYQKACAAEWIKLFASRRNRVEAWTS